MAVVSIEDYVALVKAHNDQDETQFRHVLKVTAIHESAAGHGNNARTLHRIVDHLDTTPVTSLDAGGKYATINPTASFNDLVLPAETKNTLSGFVEEWRQKDKLANYGLFPRRKLLLEGPPGTGKTMTAQCVAKELGIPLHVLQAHGIIAKYLGETAARLHEAFSLMRQHPGVFLLDEFDSFATDRGRDGEVGEMRRIVNTLLQLLDRDIPNRIIIAATNNRGLLDKAVYRRFDTIIHYNLPTVDETMLITKQILRQFTPDFECARDTAKEMTGLSQAEIRNLCLNAARQAALADSIVDNKTLLALAKHKLAHE